MRFQYRIYWKIWSSIIKLNMSNSEARYWFFILITKNMWQCQLMNTMYNFRQMFYTFFLKFSIHKNIKILKIYMQAVVKYILLLFRTTMGYHFFRMSGSANVSYSVESDFFLSSNMLILSSSISCKMSAALFNSSATTRSFWPKKSPFDLNWK